VMGCRDEDIGRSNSGEYKALDQAVTVGVVIGCTKDQAASENEVAGVMVQAKYMSECDALNHAVAAGGVIGCMKNQAAGEEGSAGAMVEAGCMGGEYGALNQAVNGGVVTRDDEEGLGSEGGLLPLEEGSVVMMTATFRCDGGDAAATTTPAEREHNSSMPGVPVLSRPGVPERSSSAPDARSCVTPDSSTGEWAQHNSSAPETRRVTESSDQPGGNLKWRRKPPASEILLVDGGEMTAATFGCDGGGAAATVTPAEREHNSSMPGVPVLSRPGVPERSSSAPDARSCVTPDSSTGEWAQHNSSAPETRRVTESSDQPGGNLKRRPKPPAGDGGGGDGGAAAGGRRSARSACPSRFGGAFNSLEKPGKPGSGIWPRRMCTLCVSETRIGMGLCLDCGEPLRRCFCTGVAVEARGAFFALRQSRA
ncbi:hypothetical protein, partial [Limnohabitans sp.]|uniref:hypothetical protein n=1 Tax=Limnohabitans sp. TaxID=1907725 RepID=UPI00333F7612